MLILCSNWHKELNMMNKKKQIFVQFYNAPGETFKNASKSAIAAGYSAKTAGSAGYRLLKDPEIKALCDEHSAKLCEELEISAKQTLLKLHRGQEFDVRKLYSPERVLLQPWELDDATAACIVGAKFKDGKVVEYKVIDSKGCAELVGRHLKLFTDKLEVEVGDGLAESIQAARQRAKVR